jgi:hypothetical protein
MIVGATCSHMRFLAAICRYMVVYHWAEWRHPRTLIEDLSWESQAIIYN